MRLAAIVDRNVDVVELEGLAARVLEDRRIDPPVDLFALAT